MPYRVLLILFWRVFWISYNFCNVSATSVLSLVCSEWKSHSNINIFGEFLYIIFGVPKHEVCWIPHLLWLEYVREVQNNKRHKTQSLCNGDRMRDKDRFLTPKSTKSTYRNIYIYIYIYIYEYTYIWNVKSYYGVNIHGITIKM